MNFVRFPAVMNGSDMKDIRIGARMLAKTPLFTLFAASVLAVTIGANISVFSFAKAVFWRPLSVPRPDLFVRLYTYEDDVSQLQTTIGDYLQYRDQAQSFEEIAAYSWVPDGIRCFGSMEERRRRWT